MLLLPSLPGIALAFLVVAMPVDAASQLAVHVVPARPFVENATDGTQAVNCDFAIVERGDEPLELERIELSVFDTRGELEYRRFVDANGRTPSIDTLVARTLPAHGSLAVFNPFANLPTRLRLARLHVVFWFDRQRDAADVAANHDRSPIDDDVSVAVDVRPRAYAGRTRLRLPLAGPLLVWDGHDFYAHHCRYVVTSPQARRDGVSANSNRYAYDFVPVDPSGAMFAGSPWNVRHWYGFGHTIVAPGSGTIVSVTNDVPENGYRGRHLVGPHLAPGVDPYGMGNHVILDHGDGEYSVLFHMQPGSVHVRVGQHVVAGEPLGRLGSSGDSLFPHLHYAVWSGPRPERDEGVPSSFEHFARLLGSRTLPVARGPIDSGEFVTSLYR